MIVTVQTMIVTAQTMIVNSPNLDSKKLTFEQIEFHICAILGDEFRYSEAPSAKI